MQNVSNAGHPTEWIAGPTAIGGQQQVHPVSSPAQLRSSVPLSAEGVRTVRAGRLAARRVLAGDDDRLLVVVGPCSIHDVAAGLAYASSLVTLADELVEDLLVVMRVYVEKPRTSLGWTGLLADPTLDGVLDIDLGLRMSRALMAAVIEQGLPVATEWLSPHAPVYLADLVSWGAIGARTVESQVHRQIASGLPMPVGMKNGSAGSVQVAVDAMRFAANPQAYVAHDLDGGAAMLRTTGNPDCNVVLRGSSDGPNHHPENVQTTVERLEAANLPTGIVIDASHGNCGKDHLRQAEVAGEIGEQLADGSTNVRGVMLESFLIPGRQDLNAGEPVFGQSVTDPCMGWEATVGALRHLAAAVRERRRVIGSKAAVPA